MSSLARIPTPWQHRWRRFRYGMLPLLVFPVCLVLMFWLWRQQSGIPNMVGAVEAVRVDVKPGTAGRLIPLSRAPWTLFDSVQQGELVARLDDESVQARLTTACVELGRLRKAVDAAWAQLATGESDRERDHLREFNRLNLELEQCRLTVLDRQSQIAVDQLELQRLNLRVDYMEPLYKKNMVPKATFENEQMLRDVIDKRIEENKANLKTAVAQQAEIEKRLKQYPALLAVEAEKILAPVREAISVQFGRIQELHVDIELLEVRAPISGTICAIYHWPGENVQPTDPIVTIAADHGRFIVSYVRQEQRLQVVKDAPVEVRLRAPGSPPMPTLVERVGPHVESVPLHQCRDPRYPEWGLPVRIRLPEKFVGRPGELVDVTFKPLPLEEEGG